MRRQMLDVPAVETLARFDEVEIVFLKLSSLDRSLLAALIAVLRRRSERGYRNKSQHEQVITNASEQLPETGIDLEMRIPQASFDVQRASGFEVLEYGVLTCRAKPGKADMRQSQRLLD